MTEYTKEISDLSELERDLDLLMRLGGNVVARSIARFTQDPIMTEAVEEAPKKTGALKRSGTVNEPITMEGETLIEFGFGAKNLKDGYNYAVIQHENPEYHHRIGKWKYLEDPFNRHAHHYPDVILGALDGLIGVKSSPSPASGINTSIDNNNQDGLSVIYGSGPTIALPEKSDSTEFQEYLGRFPD